MNVAAPLRAIEIARIDSSNRLRPINPNVVAALAEEHAQGGRWTPIRVVERGEGFRLISGGHRVATASKLGLAAIEAEVFPAAVYPDEASIRLDEVRENLLRYELTALDRAIHLATWKGLYEAQKAVKGHGGKRAGAGRQSSRKILRLENGTPQTSAKLFEERFSQAAAKALDISECSIQQAVAIAEGVALAVRERIAFAAIADNASELVQLSKQHPDRQARIVNLLLSEPAEAKTVAEAVALLDKTPPPAKLTGWRKVSDVFARLKVADQAAFFDAHAEAIDAWRAARTAPERKAA